MTFRFRVVETINHDVIYTVEADTIEEAKYKADIGETTSEVPGFESSVINRTIIEECDE